MFSNFLSVLLAPLCLVNVSANTGLNKDILPFEDKVIYNLQTDACTTAYQNSSENVESSEISVVLQFSETFSCSHEKMDTFEEVLEHRQELKEYYSVYNMKIVESLNLADNTGVVISNYGPFIEYSYDNYETFESSDYKLLEEINPAILEKVFIEKYDFEECATRNAKWESNDYEFSQALKDVGIPTEKAYIGSGVKIGLIELYLPSKLDNLNGIYYETHGIDTDSHSFETSSILGGTSGIANGAELYFAATRNSSIYECVDWLIEKGVNVINSTVYFYNKTTLYPDGNYGSISAYVDYIVQETKVTYVSSAGNHGDLANRTTEPSTGVNVICVASNDSNLAISHFSSFGIESKYYRSMVNPTLTAPGEKLDGVDNIDELLSGTSFSAPIVTGIVAMLMEEFPILKAHPEQVMALLTNSCTKALGQVDTYDTDAGFGIINYELARQNFKHTINFDIDKDIPRGGPVFNTYVKLDFDDKLTAKAFVLLNRNSSSEEYVNLDYSDITIRIYNERTDELVWGDVISNFGYIEFTNTTYLNSEQTTKIFWLEVYALRKNTNNYENEHCAVSYSIEKYSDTYSLDGLVIKNNIITGFFAPDNFNGHIIIPNWITGIANRAFLYNEDVTCVTFEEGSQLTTIEYLAFSCCYNLRYFVIPESVTTMGYSVFAFSEQVSIHTSLKEAPFDWDPLWDLKFVDYWGMGNDLRNGTLHENEYYYTYHTIHWGA